MIILSLTCDNLYMFKNFSIDFTYGGGTEDYAICRHDALFLGSSIYVRKRLILLGANASGKTTFGELLCAVSNFLLGRAVKPGALNLYRALYNDQKAGSFTVEVVLPVSEKKRNSGYMAYRVGCRFTADGEQTEWVQKTDVQPGDTIEKLRSSLDAAEKIEGGVPQGTAVLGEEKGVYGAKREEPFISKILGNANPALHLGPIVTHEGMGFHYIFSSFADSSQPFPIHVPVDLFNKVLPIIDNSISSVDALTIKGNDTPTASYIIRFKNGSLLTIPDNDLRRADRTRLSHGTFEVLSFLNDMEEVRHRLQDTFFIDEQLAHLHAELEAYFIMRLFQLDSEGQLFVTSHTSDLLDLNVPQSTFLLFKRNKDQSVSTVFMDEKLKDKDVDIRDCYENDYFGILPDYSVLDRFFEKDVE